MTELEAVRYKVMNAGRGILKKLQDMLIINNICSGRMKRRTIPGLQSPCLLELIGIDTGLLTIPPFLPIESENMSGVHFKHGDNHF